MVIIGDQSEIFLKMKEKETPMMRQYNEIKAQNPDAILFFRLGDFYEMFGDDAILSARILNITLTARNKGENKMAMCGVPYHAAEGYIAKLTRAGKKVAVCEQVSDPSEPGIVERAVVRIITPGTTFDDNVLDRKANSFILSISSERENFGIAVCDLTTATFKTTQLKGLDDLTSEVLRIKPKEFLINEETDENLINYLQKFEDVYISKNNLNKTAEKEITEHFGVANLEGFGLGKLHLAVEAAANLLNYLKETQKNSLDFIKKIQVYKCNETMLLDEATIKNLDLFINSQESGKRGSLFWLLDQTSTAMGGRLLQEWLFNPLLEREKIEKRLISVNYFFEEIKISDELKNILDEVYDLERIVSRIGCLGGNGRDLTALKQSLGKIPEIKKLLNKCEFHLVKESVSDMENLDELYDLIDRSIDENCPVSNKEGNLIKKGYDANLDELKNLVKESRSALAEMESNEIKRTGINSLKIGFNKVFGYYIEIRNNHLKNVPAEYIRKQTLVNAERFITQELKEYEEKILNAQNKMAELEFGIFNKVREEVMKNFDRIQKNARLIALIDVLNSFAQVARRNKYSLPQINCEGIIEIEKGRHPIIEILNKEKKFIANSVNLRKESRLKLITGPNMAGKSTYLRQTAIIVLLAHIGSFVPAEKANISLVDRIFTRVGASDNLIKGQSTFMVEMQEAANILNNASEKSLVILDEIGRGTSTFDGVSIAWAIMEYIHSVLKSKTLFATHYHELIETVESLDGAENLCVAVSENRDGIVFLYQIISGAINRSYGIEVAKIAGLPKKIIERSNEVLKTLESKESPFSRNKIKEVNLKNEDQLNLFSTRNANEERVIKALKNININQLTPLEALQKINDIQSQIQ